MPVSWSKQRIAWIAAAILVLAIGGWLLVRMQQLQSQVAELSGQAEAARQSAERAESQARRSAERATAAEQRATAAESTAGRALTQADTETRRREASDVARRTAELDALVAQQEAERAEADAVAAMAEAARVRAEREREMTRMQEALGSIADTRRTALGLVMNLGEEAINFDTDKAILKPRDRELLSRIVGVLLTSTGYRIQVFGHTDDVGTPRYNQRLSERRANAVADYLVAAGLDPEIITRRGFGLTKPLAEGTSAEARARNRRVELGIIDSSVEYRSEQRPVSTQR